MRSLYKLRFRLQFFTVLKFTGAYERVKNARIAIRELHVFSNWRENIVTSQCECLLFGENQSDSLIFVIGKLLFSKRILFLYPTHSVI